MPTKNSTGKGKAEGKSGTVAKPKKLAVKKETIADPAAAKDAEKNFTHTCASKRCY